MAKLIIKNLKKKFDKNGPEIVRGVNLEVKNKDFVVVVGPSGCGKSTFLRMVAGLERVSEGDVFIDEVRINNLEPKDRNIAMVFQNYALYPHMNVFKNIAYALRIAGVPKAEIQERVKKTAEILKLTPFLDRKPSQLSGGQRQRVAMGRALIREPKIFLFDEPLSNLDAKLRVQTRVEIKKLQQSLGITSIFVTHDQVEAMTLADTLVVMNQGVFEQVGSPMDIYRNPTSIFVASFIGSPPMNLIKGTLEKPQLLRLNPDFSITLPTVFHDSNYLGKEIVIGIRAEHFKLQSFSKMNNFKSVLKGGEIYLKLDVVEELGDEEILCGSIYEPQTQSTYFYTDAGDNLQNLYASFPLKEIEEMKFQSSMKAGDIVQLKFDSQHIHYFDPISEKRIK